MSADVVADMLTTKCSHPSHGERATKFYLDSLLPLIVDGKAVGVCFQCFKNYEADNAGAPREEIKTARFFTRLAASTSGAAIMRGSTTSRRPSWSKPTPLSKHSH